jgi:hypothetical protein
MEIQSNQRPFVMRLATGMLVAIATPILTSDFAMSAADINSTCSVSASSTLVLSQALAPRAVGQLHSWCVHMRAWVTRTCRWSIAESAENGEHALATVARPQSAESVSSGGDDHDREQVFQGLEIDDGVQRIRRLHETSLDAARHLALFTQLGLMAPPMVFDTTGRMQGTSLSEALAVLQTTDSSMLAFRWFDHGPSPMDELLDKLVGSGDATTERIARLRKQLRDLRSVWLVAPTDGFWRRTPEFRAAMDSVARFTDAMGKVERTLDPSMAIFASDDDPAQAIDGHSRKDLELLEDMLDAAEDLALLDAETGDAERLTEIATVFGRSRLGSHGQHLAAALERALKRAGALHERLRGGGAGRTTRAGPERSSSLRASFPQPDHGSLRVEIPGEDVSVELQGGLSELFAMVIDPENGNERQAPWLYGLEVVLARSEQSADRPEQSVSVVAVVNEATGARHLRRLRPQARDPNDRVTDEAYESAVFVNLPRGWYRVELMAGSSMTDGANGSSDHPALSRAAPSGWRRMFSGACWTWKWPWARMQRPLLRKLHSAA